MARIETGLTKQAIISELTRSPHAFGSDTKTKGVKKEKLDPVVSAKKLYDAYAPVGLRAAAEDPEFYAHFVAWNFKVGQIKDAKIALPVFGLTQKDRELVENAAAHLAMLDPRMFLRAMEFSRVVPGVPRRAVQRLVTRYLHEKHGEGFDHAVKQHRASLKRLYSMFHVPVGDNRVRALLFDRAATKQFPAAHAVEYPSAVLTSIRELPKMSDQMAADVIVRYKIPFLVVKAQLGKRLENTDLLLAMIKQMSPTELVSEMKLLEKMGVQTRPETRAALAAAMETITSAKPKKGGPAPTLKTTKAVQALRSVDAGLAQKMERVQEEQLDRLGNIEGDWLVLGDKSSSMSASINMARELAATIARVAKGKVHLVFFDTMPRYIDATGKTLAELSELTRMVSAGGCTSVGCGMQYAMDRGFIVQGIAIVSDGGENRSPFFSQAYVQYSKKFSVDPPVYVFEVPGDDNVLVDNCQRTGIDVHTLLDRKQRVDYYSMPNLVMTMRAERYAVVDEILATPLKRLDDVLVRSKLEVFRESRAVAEKVSR